MTVVLKVCVHSLVRDTKNMQTLFSKMVDLVKISSKKRLTFYSSFTKQTCYLNKNVLLFFS